MREPVEGQLWGSDFRLGYSPPAGSFDEMLGQGGTGLHPVWREIAAFMADMGHEDWQARWDRGRRTMRQQGVTYNIYSDAPDRSARWKLDPVPLVLSGSEWRALAGALTQRATLLDLILRDLLGPQRLLAEGHLPPALVFGHPGFFRATVDPAAANRQRLFVYAADLARGPDGQWRIMMDRTEAPTGFGYALSNRTILAQVFPELMRTMDVRPVSGFFSDIRRGLQAAAPAGRDDPRIVVLSPGRRNEAYFEHAFMARQLGCALVEAEDLTVRGGEVFLKTLQGLQQVDVIFRRTDTAFCDPLELRSTSALGVSGLTHAMRKGRVAVVNALGSGVVEQPGLMPFLPGLCRRLLGEELQLAATDTWWCGQPVEREHVLENLGRLVVKPAFPAEVGEPVFAAAGGAEAEEALRRAIADRPQSHVGQEMVRLSTAPTWSQHGLEPRAIMLRMLLCWTPGGWTVMPGGMVRVAPTPRDPVVSMQRGGGAKDVWVLRETESGESDRQIRRAERTVAIRRDRTNLPSSAAESLYWLGRYLERAASLSRRVRGAVRNVDERIVQVATGDEAVALRNLLGSGIFRVTGGKKAPAPEMLVRHAGRIFLDTDEGVGLRDIVGRLKNAADTVRVLMSADSWLGVTRVEETLEAARRASARPALLADRIDDIVYALQALNGSMHDSMPRGHAWRFYDLGRRLEMALQLLDLLADTLVQPQGGSRVVLQSVLDINDSGATYRDRYRDQFDLAAVLDLMVCDQSHPRSLAHHLDRVTQHVEELSELRGPLPGEDRHIAIRTFAAVQLADAMELAQTEADGTRPRLEQLVELLQGHLPEINEALARRYFTHVDGRGRQFAIGAGTIVEGVV